MKFLIAERISANKYKTPEGYLVCVDSVLARTGKQTYRKNEIFVDCNDDTEIEVDRKPEEVFSEATLASFENKPITIEHPDEDVNTGNFKNLAVGFVRDIHRGKDNGQDVMLGTLVITDEEAISAVESGELLDLSCGYDCDIEDSANPQQRNIRGNHVALCESGRAGIARIVDSVKDNDELPEEEDSTFRYSGARGEEIFVTNYDGRNTFLVSGGKLRYNEKMMQRRDVERYLDEHGAKFSKVIDSIEDAKLPSNIKKNIQRVLSARSTFTSRDIDVSDVVKEIERYCKIDGTPVKLVRESIKGWFKTGDGMMRKDYVFAVEGYSNRILISMYANPDTWKTTELNGYFIDSVNDATMKEYIFKFIPNEFTSKPVEVKFPCLNNELALATLRRSWTWIKMISVKVDGKEVKYQNGKIIDSEETEMKDKLIDIPSNLLSKLEDMFKQKNIHVARKGKTFTGRIHYQVEFGGSVRDLVRKLEEIEKTAKSLNIPMTFAADGNDDDTFATAGVDFDKQYVVDSDVEDGKNAAENAVESAMKELGITKEQLSSKRKDVEMKISSKGLYGRTQAGWFVDDYIKNYCKDSEELISDDEDIFTKAINDEVTAIELYNQILAGDLDDETRAIIEEIRDDENDHLVKLTKLKNDTVDENDVVEDKHIKDGKYVSDLKIGDIIRLKDGSKWKVASIRKNFLGIQVRMNSLSTPVITKEVTYNPTDMLAYDSMKDEEVDDAMQTFEIRWIDTYKKSKGYVKEEYLHIDKIKANSLSEALKKLADNVALMGVGTMNAMVISIHSDKASYMYSGKLGELVRKVKDSSKIERAIKAIRAMRKL